MSDAQSNMDGSSSELTEALYTQLRAIARRQLEGERRGHTLSATALVHEAYLKLAGPRKEWAGRGHFFVAAALAMRRLLLDHAKARGRLKRGGGRAGGTGPRIARIDLDAAATLVGEAADGGFSGPDPEDFVALDDALRRLSGRDARMAEVVMLRFFAGLEIAAVARVLGVSERTVKSDWAFARAWLERELRAGRNGGAS